MRIGQEEDTEIPAKAPRICSALSGHGRCTRKRTNGSCRGEEGLCRGYKILTTPAGPVEAKPLKPIVGAYQDPIFPIREVSSLAIDVVM
jgi:hypothetical protein